ncbi:thioesterase II family protein [Amycolatopsis sp. NPDC059027]|uniref:thioesterase II family protein n=1 Tax=unclassified Amycolatopsis TaxID=2618356 RepID=UPI00366F0539
MTSAISGLSPGDPEPARGHRYLCFPPAGGTLGTMRGIGHATSGAWGVEYPGRGDRLLDPLPGTLEELAEQIAREILGEFGPRSVPRTVLAGFSMGAFVAFEAAQRIQAWHGVAPAAVVVVGACAPQRRVPGGFARTDAVALGRLLDRNGLTPVIGYREHPEAWEYALDLLRGDLRLMGAYHGPAEVALPCPVAALCGSDDHAFGTVDDATGAWRRWTTGRFFSAVVPGGHLGLLDAGREAEFWRWMHRIEQAVTEQENSDA